MSFTTMRASRRAAVLVAVAAATLLPPAGPSPARAEVTAPTPAGVTAPTRSVALPPAEVTATDVTVHSGALDLPGTVFAPAVPGRPPAPAPPGAAGTPASPGTPGAATPGTRRPGVVIVHDAGPRPRATYEAEARLLAAAGIVTLVYDKRTEGYSLTLRSFEDLAGDAVAAVEVLRARPDVGPALVGLLGRSEGGWVAPLAASRSDRVGFVVTVGASGLSPARAQVWSNMAYLEHAGVASSLRGPLGADFTRQLVAAGLFGAAGHDPVVPLERVRQPVLAVFGANDRSTAPGESVRLFGTALARGGNPHHTIRVLPGADHTMHHSPDGFARATEPAPGYVDLVTSWVTGLGRRSPETSADPAPAQFADSVAVRPLAWYESGAVQLGALALMLVAFLAYPVGALVRRLRRGRRAPDRPLGRVPARILAVLGPLTVLGGLGYLGYVSATAARALGPVVAGRPLPWLVLQLLAVVLSFSLAAVAVAFRKDRTARARLGTVLAGGLVFLPWAAYWGLLTP
ncbi:acyl-CoA thioester hydrolase/BAAT C-terminal domain-containing protein [Longispora sp. NPDC051575]|uniref:alpha/beta hydrolase family protein n=1 Tax=Longispora sp. NPDC051575 TaxID=3154943 RepID=UPI0034399DF0